MKNYNELKDKIEEIKSQIQKTYNMKREESEVWLRGYWTALEWVKD